MNLRHAIHAFLLNRFAVRYNRLTAPVKSQLFGELSGDVLEIGAGSGANFPFFSPSIRWTGTDPNSAGWRYAARHAAQHNIPAGWQTAPAESLPFPSASFDSVAASLTLCSVQSPEQALREVYRVLKPGGRFVFLEHVAAPPSSPLLRRQKRWRPVFEFLAGCRPDQDTAALVRDAGFSTLEVDILTLPLPVVGPHVAGRATR